MNNRFTHENKCHLSYKRISHMSAPVKNRPSSANDMFFVNNGELCRCCRALTSIRNLAFGLPAMLNIFQFTKPFGAHTQKKKCYFLDHIYKNSCQTKKITLNVVPTNQTQLSEQRISHCEFPACIAALIHDAVTVIGSLFGCLLTSFTVFCCGFVSYLLYCDVKSSSC